PVVLTHAPLGYLTAYQAEEPDLDRPVELWPRMLQREVHLTNLQLFKDAEEEHPHETLQNVHKILHTRSHLGGAPLPRSFARQPLTLPRDHTLTGWLDSLPARGGDEEKGRRLAEELRRAIEPEPPRRGKRPRPPRSLTFHHTARRSFEVAYWKTIA